MLDALLRRPLDGFIAPVAVRVAGLRISAVSLTASAFVCGAIALVDIGHQYYRVGLVFLFAARLFDVLDGPVARRKPPTVFGPYLAHVLDMLIAAAVPFAFALAAPGRALAAMFLMLGLLVRAAAFDGTTRPPGTDPVIGYFGRVGRLVEKTDLFVAFALACLFPDWFSLIAYAVGILCFITAGGRVAAVAAQEP
jgi:phosphatidylglycerophosphate synthase